MKKITTIAFALALIVIMPLVFIGCSSLSDSQQKEDQTQPEKQEQIQQSQKQGLVGTWAFSGFDLNGHPASDLDLNYLTEQSRQISITFNSDFTGVIVTPDGQGSFEWIKENTENVLLKEPGQNTYGTTYLFKNNRVYIPNLARSLSTNEIVEIYVMFE